MKTPLQVPTRKHEALVKSLRLLANQFVKESLTYKDMIEAASVIQSLESEIIFQKGMIAGLEMRIEELTKQIPI